MDVDYLRNCYKEYRKSVIIFEYELRKFLDEAFKSVVCLNFILGDCTHNFMLQLKVVPLESEFDINSSVISALEEQFGFICEEVSSDDEGVYIQFIERNVFNG